MTTSKIWIKPITTLEICIEPIKIPDSWIEPIKIQSVRFEEWDECGLPEIGSRFLQFKIFTVI